MRATLDDVANAGSVILLDTPTAEEFDGQAEMDHRPGHIPGAVNLPHVETAGADGNLLIDEFELRERLGIVGVANNDSVIAYCRSGVRASVAWLAMRQNGYDVRLYDGSYAEWGWTATSRLSLKTPSPWWERVGVRGCPLHVSVHLPGTGWINPL